jgi:hypothetical protein
MRCLPCLMWLLATFSASTCQAKRVSSGNPSESASTRIPSSHPTGHNSRGPSSSDGPSVRPLHANSTGNSTGPSVTQTAGTTSTPTNAAPIWNLNNTSCYDLDHIKTGAQQWAALGGDQVLKNFTTSYNNDYTFCRQCMGWPQGQCPEGQQGNPQFDQNCVPGVKSISSGRWDRAAAHFAVITSDEDMSCGLEASGCVASASCEDAIGPGVSTPPELVPSS